MGVAALDGFGLQEAHRRKISCLHGFRPIVQVILMVGFVAVLADHSQATGPNVLGLGRGGIVLERLAVRAIVVVVCTPVTVEDVPRLHPVVPFGWVAVKSNPSEKQPQVTW
jgi:hypothetical protein